MADEDILNRFADIVQGDAAPGVADFLSGLQRYAQPERTRLEADAEAPGPSPDYFRDQLGRLQGGQFIPWQPPPPLGDTMARTAIDLMGFPAIKEAQERGQEAAASGDYLSAAGEAGKGALGMIGLVPGAALATKGMSRAAALAEKLREPKFAKYANEYPPVGPPTMVPKDPNDLTKGYYPEKTLTPEALAVQKERVRIQNDMDKNGYEPYFKPEDRAYVDPSNYPPRNIDTSTLGPKKLDTVAEYAAGIVGAPETKAALEAAYKRGLELGNAEHWYALAQLERAYIKELGVKKGREAFLDEFAVPMGATTSGNDPTFNLMFAHYVEYRRKKGLPLMGKDEGNQLPYPVGGRYAGDNLSDYKKIREGGGYKAVGETQPKMHNFIRSLIGDLTQPTMDEQMAGGMLRHMTSKFINNARKTAYGILQSPVDRMAEELNAARPVGSNQPPILPGNVQDVAWAGFKNVPGKPMIDHINDAIERTHRLTGRARDEIVRLGLVRKEIPLYGALGGVGLGAAQGEYGR